MDKTEKYILMCKRADEIQEIWRTTADWNIIPSFVYDKISERVCIITYLPKSLRDKIDSSSEMIVLSIERNRDKNLWIQEGAPPSESCVWLPDQSQLQEMVDWKGLTLLFRKSDSLMFDYELHWEKNNTEKGYGKVTIGSSMEQLWLAFIMSELYRKQWDGEEWKTA